jgi:hypothetical protein
MREEPLGFDVSRALVVREQTYSEALASALAETILMLWKQLPLLVDCQICFGGGWVPLQLVQPFVLEALASALIGSILCCENSQICFRGGWVPL